MDATEGKLTPVPAADLQAQILQFYWADSGVKALKCTVTGGASKDGTGELMVNSPSIDPAYTAKQGTVRFLTPKKTQFGLYGTPGTIEQGMQFSATVKMVDGWTPGKWEFVQTVVPATTVTAANGQKKAWSLNGMTVLDDTVPYTFKGPTKADGPAGPWPTGTPGGAVDSPRKLLIKTLTTRVSVDTETYKMYIMFLPPGHKPMWVPLQYWGWSWKGTATFAKGTWTLAGQGQAVDSAATDTTDHPIWKKRAQDGTFK